MLVVYINILKMKDKYMSLHTMMLIFFYDIFSVISRDFSVSLKISHIHLVLGLFPRENSYLLSIT